MNLPKLQPNAALAAAYERDIAAGINPRAFEPDPNPPQPVVEMAQAFHPPPPDWDQEARERLARERQAKEAELAGVLEAELERIAREDTEPYPAPKRRGVRDLLAGREPS